VPRKACAGGFDGDPPSGHGPAEILPFPVQKVRRGGMAADDGGCAQDSAWPHDDPSAELRAQLDPPYWPDWMRAILDKRASLLVPA
jgi:hypothetical protein